MGLRSPDGKPTESQPLVFDFVIVAGAFPAMERLLAGILSAPIEQAGLKVKAAELARVIVFGMKGFKDVAKDGKEMRKMIAAHVAIVTAALQPMRGKKG